MFAGHYGASFALKRVEQRASLGYLFLAAQFMDVVWAVLVLFGIERVQVVRLPSSPLIMTFIPFTHSLEGSLFWALVVFLGFRFLPAFKGTRPSRVALIMALAVFSHWVLDLLVHRPDLGLLGDADKVGLGLYNYPAIAFPLEALVLGAGLWLYLRSTVATSARGAYGFYVFFGVLILINVMTYWPPMLFTPPQIAVFNETFYFAMASVALWLDRGRTARAVPADQQATAHVAAVVAQRRPVVAR